MFDYFAFLEANDLAWDEQSVAPGLSVLARYRDWSSGELGLDSSTVNKRLALIVRFYRWAKLRGLVSLLPFSEKRVRVAKNLGLLSHTTCSAPESTKPSVMVRERRRLTKSLTKSQAKVCLALNTDPSHKILFHLMLRTGLRSCEARSFPVKYVFNPRLKKGLRQGQMISVALEPNDMYIKFGRPGTIDVPWSLMEAMWSYSLHQREIRKSHGDGNVSALLLTKEGRKYSKDSVVDVMKAYEKDVDFTFVLTCFVTPMGLTLYVLCGKVRALGEIRCCMSEIELGIRMYKQ